ncbi:MAG: hypothetical protein JST80_11395 [Bdellovibrionales bacterium]|nr:hypothetical protein [Bdellovibrionales bacterium]
MQRGLCNIHKGVRPADHVRKYACLITVALLSSSFLTGCYETSLTPLQFFVAPKLNPPKTVDVNFCMDPAVPEKFVVKTVIILDHSGSNKQNVLLSADGSGAPQITNNAITVSANYATDPTGILRYGDLATPGSLLNFLSTLPANDPADPLRYFASVDFSDQAYTYPNGASGFTSDIPAFYNQMLTNARGGNPNNAAGVPADTGATSYMSALNATYAIISSDIVKAQNCAKLATTTAPSANCPHPGVQVASSYVIIFASDGAPIISITGVDANNQVTGQLQTTREATGEILGQVQALTALTANTKFVAGVNLFSVYYYNPTNNIDNSAKQLLADMARVGQGISYSALSGSKIDYTRFQPPARLIKYLLSDIFVTNESGVWAKDGTFANDADSDGISDADETARGSNPNNADSNGNGANDLVEMKLGASMNLGMCSGVTKAGGKYHESDPNGLNDCEKILLSDTGGVNNPDSNGDGMPDWTAFKNGVPFQLNSVASYLSTLSDGYTQYQKVKYSLPVSIPFNQILNPRASNYALTMISNNASQACYKLEVTDLPYSTETDKIRVQIIERSELLQDRYLYRTASKNHVTGQNLLIFNDWNDAAEIAAQTWKVWP